MLSQRVHRSHTIRVNLNRLGSLFSRRVRFSTHLERWKSIGGFSLYEASTWGNVRNNKREKLLTINIERFKSINASPTARIKSDTGKWSSLLVNRLILKCFEPRGDANNLFAIHIDGNKYNNHISNLRWSEKSYKYQSKTTNAELKLFDVTYGSYMHFDSLVMCWKYLLTLNIKLSTPKMLSVWCSKKLVRHGYQFEYVDETKYCTKIQDLNGEQWR
eukprot:423885_1